MPTGFVASATETADAATAQRAARATDPRVKLVLRGMAGRLAIDGADPFAYASDYEHRLSVGAHEIQVIPEDPQCERPAPWRITVRSSPSGAVQELLSPAFNCHSTVAATGNRAGPSANARTGTALVRGTQPAGEIVNVRLIVRGPGGLISIDGRDAHEHDNGIEYPLSPGPHVVQVIPVDSSCARPAPWAIDVQPTAEGVPLRLTSPRFACVARATPLSQPSP
jgi:hypothetical protein